MATVIDLLRSLGRRAGPGGAQALRGPVALPARPVRAVALNNVEPSLSATWQQVTGRPTEAAHALALAASRAGEPVAVMAYSPVQHEDLLLVGLAHLVADPSATALWLVPDERSARMATTLLTEIALRLNLAWQPVGDASGRTPGSRLIVATYDDLHQRVLRFADRAWQWLWPRLRLIALPDLHRAAGAEGTHLGWLLRRAERLATHRVGLLAGLAPVAEPDEVLATLFGRAWHVVEADPGCGPTLIGVWRCVEREVTIRHLANELIARRLGVTVLGRDRRETDALRTRLADVPGLLVGQAPNAARVAIASGIPVDADERDALLRRGYRLLIMLAGDEPHEILFAADMDLVPGSVPHLPCTMANAYIASRHLQWAAGEAPLSTAELDRWQMRELAGRLVGKHMLRETTGGLMQPGDSAVEHAGALQSAVGDAPPVAVRDPGGATIAYLPPLVADWRALPGTTWLPGIAVAGRADDPPTADLAAEEGGRLALPVLTLRVTPRAELASYPVRLGARTVTVSQARLSIDQRVDGLLEYAPGTPPRRTRLGRPTEGTWNGHGCSIPLPVPPPYPEVAGWSVRIVLPFIARTRPEDVLVSYEAATALLWIVETHPGGTGISDALAHAMPRLFGMARRLAQVAADSPLYGELARAELAWLDPLHRPEHTPVEQSDLTAVSLPAETPAPVTPVDANLRARRPRIYAARGGTDLTPQPADLTPQSPSLPGKGEHDSPPLVGEAGAPWARERSAENSVSEPPIPTPARQQAPDVGSMIARMRRLREERERDAARSALRPSMPPAAIPPATLRFRPDQRVRCVPYGEGVIREARVVDGREQLTITFPALGDVDVDPAVNVVRVLDEAPENSPSAGELDE